MVGAILALCSVHRCATCALLPALKHTRTYVYTHTHTRDNRNLASGTSQLPHNMNPRILDKDEKGE